MTRPAFRTLADLERDSLALFLGYRAELEERAAAAAPSERPAVELLADLSAAINRAASGASL